MANPLPASFPAASELPKKPRVIRIILPHHAVWASAGFTKLLREMVQDHGWMLFRAFNNVPSFGIAWGGTFRTIEQAIMNA